MTSRVDSIIRKHLVPSKNYIYGFADLTGLLDSKFKGYNYGISIGRLLDDIIVDQIINGPTPEYYSHYREANEILSIQAKNISEELNQNNIETINIEPTVQTSELNTIYFNSLRTDLSHKMVATRAGLGWIGKTDLFISRKIGPRLRLVSILIKYPVKSELKPINKSKCGNCNICVGICPAKAANGNLWDTTVEREEFFDPRRCREKCAEYGRTNLGKDAMICGICVAACPVGRKKLQK